MSLEKRLASPVPSPSANALNTTQTQLATNAAERALGLKLKKQRGGQELRENLQVLNASMHSRKSHRPPATAELECRSSTSAARLRGKSLCSYARHGAVELESQLFQPQHRSAPRR